MSQIHLSIKHGRSLEDARARLREAVEQVRQRFPMMVQRVDWAASGDAVQVAGTGFSIDMRVDPQDLHVDGNLTFLGGLLSGPFTTGLKQIVQKTFAKRLT